MSQKSNARRVVYQSNVTNGHIGSQEQVTERVFSVSQSMPVENGYDDNDACEAEPNVSHICFPHKIFQFQAS